MNRSQFKPRGLATAVGSMPHKSPEEACSLVLEHLPQIPAWPQLSQRSFLENMYVQFSEGFPGVIVQDDRIYVDRSQDLDPALERLYSAYLKNNVEHYGISPDHAAGLYSFLSSELGSAMAVKGQVTGPVSFGLVVADQEQRPIIYDPVLADALAKHLRLKAAWQEKLLRTICPNTIVFVDEPYLASLGSAFISLNPEHVVALLEEVFQGIEGLKGIHCCGNTDWSVLLSTSLDILNFDAYNYGESITLYPAEAKRFLERGGIIAWGIVPNNEQALAEETVNSLLHRLEEMMESLCHKGIDYGMLWEQCLVTPSCGLDSLSPEGATKALQLLAALSQKLRTERGL
jgi:methionine synthase II (cobalamin-independent)